MGKVRNALPPGAAPARLNQRIRTSGCPRCRCSNTPRLSRRHSKRTRPQAAGSVVANQCARVVDSGSERRAASCQNRRVSRAPRAGRDARRSSRRGVRRRPRSRPAGAEHAAPQLIGGAVLHKGRIAEMKTGEGKTLVATLPAYSTRSKAGRPHRHGERLPCPPRLGVDG